MRQTARDLRVYLIVDCCFAAALQHGFLSSPLGLAELRLDEALPNPAIFESDDAVPMAGVALLAAAGLNDPAFALPDEPYTRFTAALLEVLREGHARFPPVLSLSDLHQLVDRRINQKFPDQARPELRSLHQTRGRVELVRLFRNPAVQRIEEPHKAGGQRTTDENARLAEKQHKANGATRPMEGKRRSEVVAAGAHRADASDNFRTQFRNILRNGGETFRRALYATSVAIFLGLSVGGLLFVAARQDAAHQQEAARQNVARQQEHPRPGVTEATATPPSLAIDQEWLNCIGSKGMPDRAISSCTAVIQASKTPRDKQAWAFYYRGLGYRASGRTAQAAADLAAAKELDKSLPPFRN